MLTFLNLQDRVLRWIDEANDTDQTRTIVKDALNATHRRLMQAHPWPSLIWHREESFTTIANQRIYALHPSMGKLMHGWDVSSRQFLTIIPRREWEGVGVNRGSTNIPPYGASFGPVWPVKQQPVAGILTAVGSGGETSQFYIEGVDANAEPIQETLTLTGTTPVTTALAFSYITRVSSVGVVTGTRTLKDVSNNILLTLRSDQYAKSYPTIEFVESPEGGRVFNYTFRRRPDDLVRNYDIPNIWPNECAEILVYDTLYDLITYNTELGLKEQRIWRERRDEFMKQLLDANDEQIVGAYPRFVRDLEGGMPSARYVD